MRLVVALLSVVALAFAAPASADSPTEIAFKDVFPDVNPCTGNVMTVTIAVTAYVHEHGSREVVHGERTITTSDGFAGRGAETFLVNGQILLFRQTDIMTTSPAIASGRTVCSSSTSRPIRRGLSASS